MRAKRQTGRWRASRRRSSSCVVVLLTSAEAAVNECDFHFWQEWETARGNRQFTSQLEMRAIIVREVSALDPEAAEKACTTGFTDAWRACAPEAVISSAACVGPAHMHAFFSGLCRPVLKHGPKGLTFWHFFCASALKAPAWTSTRATDCDLKSRLRKSISVWGLSPFPSHSPSPSR